VVETMHDRQSTQAKTVIKSVLSTLGFLAHWHGNHVVNPHSPDSDYYTDEEMEERAAASTLQLFKFKRRFEACAAQVKHCCSTPCAVSSAFMLCMAPRCQQACMYRIRQNKPLIPGTSMYCAHVMRLGSRGTACSCCAFCA
jgi:hypothetical protein